MEILQNDSSRDTYQFVRVSAFVKPTRKESLLELYCTTVIIVGKYMLPLSVSLWEYIGAIVPLFVQL